MVNGMANRKTSELGGEGFAVCFDDLVSWVFTLVLGECWVVVKRRCHRSLEAGPIFVGWYLCRGEASVKISFDLLACMFRSGNIFACKALKIRCKARGRRGNVVMKSYAFCLICHAQ
jgi:hypothetical protein